MLAPKRRSAAKGAVSHLAAVANADVLLARWSGLKAPLRRPRQRRQERCISLGCRRKRKRCVGDILRAETQAPFRRPRQTLYLIGLLSQTPTLCWRDPAG